jgi:drug/metabolite transporter (DMT)-like permease
MLMVGGGAVLISFSAVFVKLANVSPLMAAFYRTFFGGIIMLAILASRHLPIWNGTATMLLGAVGGALFALDLFLWHSSIHHVGPGLATILANFQVFLLALFGIAVRGEKLSWRFGLSLVLALIGLYLLAGVEWSLLETSYRRGVILGLGAALCYAAYLLVLRWLQSRTSSPSSLANLGTISLSTALLLAAAAWQQCDSFTIPDKQSWLSLLGYALFSQVCGWWLIARGLPRVRISSSGLLLLLQPALAYTWDMLFFDPKITAASACGAATALAAIYLGITRGAGRSP